MQWCNIGGATKKRFWASPAWDVAHASVRQLLDRIIARSGGHFSWVEGVAAANLRDESKRRKHRGILWALVTPAEKAGIGFDKAVTLGELLEQLRCVKHS